MDEDSKQGGFNDAHADEIEDFLQKTDPSMKDPPGYLPGMNPKTLDRRLASKYRDTKKKIDKRKKKKKRKRSRAARKKASRRSK